MKAGLRLFVILFMFTISRAWCATSNDEELTSSLKWLTEFASSQTSSDGPPRFAFYSDKTDICYVTFEERIEALGTDKGHTEKQLFSLADIDPESIHVGGSRDTDKKTGIFKATPDQVFSETKNHVRSILIFEDGQARTVTQFFNVRLSKEDAPAFVSHFRAAVERCGHVSSTHPPLSGSLNEIIQLVGDLNDQGARKRKVDRIVINGSGPNRCSAVVKTSGGDGTREMSFSLTDIDPNSINIGETDRPVGMPDFIFFHTTNYAQTISDSVDSASASKKAESGMLLDAELNQKMVDYLKRAVELCGGRKTESPLPDAVIEFDTPTATATPKDSNVPSKNEDFDTKYYRLFPRPNYRFCKQIVRQVTLEGGSVFLERTSGNTILYRLDAYPDNVFRKASISKAHVKIMEVPIDQADRCPALKDEFPELIERGPAYGWESLRMYVDANDRLGSARSLEGDVSAFQAPGIDDVYCTHRFAAGPRSGESGYGLISWTEKSMKMFVRARVNETFGPGSHSELTLYVKYVPRVERQNDGAKLGCTAMPSPKYAHLPFKTPRIQSVEQGEMYVPE